MIQALSDVSRTLAASVPPESLAAALAQLSASLELRAASLTINGREAGADAVFHWSRGGKPARILELAARAARRVKERPMPVVVENAWLDLAEDRGPLSWMEGQLDASLVAVPVKSDSVPVGSLVVVREHSAGDQAEFSFDGDVMLLSSVANLLGLALRVYGFPERRSPDSAAGSCGFEPGRSDTSPLGVAPCWRVIEQKIASVARTNAAVLLRGETGVGKTMLARKIHKSSPRRDRRFVVLNCATLSESLVESELFGHEKGAFTGAVNQRKGRFELADGGTLFLDEIGELSGSFQAKLLRVIQTGQFERVGGTSTETADVRIIAATHRDLEGAVRSGAFRADLYYRLCVVPIVVPPLRERREDIAGLARTFVSRFNAENDADHVLLDEAIDVLARYPFPGNVRELENAVRRAASLAGSRRIAAADFSFLWEGSPLMDSMPAPSEAFQGRPLDAATGGGAGVERDRLIDALERSGWVLAKAARTLGLTPRQIGYAVRKHAIPIRKF
jgi:Nif-specific regulatory protein